MHYAGYVYDPDTQLYYLQARYYDAETARFISRDPMKGIYFDPLSQNPYLYCKSNPINLIDPDGLHYRWFKHTHFKLFGIDSFISSPILQWSELRSSSKGMKKYSHYHIYSGIKIKQLKRYYISFDTFLLVFGGVFKSAATKAAAYIFSATGLSMDWISNELGWEFKERNKYYESFFGVTGWEYYNKFDNSNKCLK